MSHYRKHLTKKLESKGRVVTGWWNDEPIHRAMTVEEMAIRDGIDPDAVNLGMTLLSSASYKPTFKL